jgi:hypothetical protein
MNDAVAHDSRKRDFQARALAWVLFAFCMGCAIDASDGSYSRPALMWLTVAAAVSLIAIALQPSAQLEAAAGNSLWRVLLIGVAFQAGLLLFRERPGDATVLMGLLFVGALGCFQAFLPGRLRYPILAIMLIAFALIAVTQFRSRYPWPGIDVFYFQQQSSEVLIYGRNLERLPAIVHGHNPYALRFHNVYDPDTPYYGPGVVDKNDFLTYGFPYPPLTLLMDLPGFLLGGDIRLSLVGSMVLAAALMATARPGKIAVLAATLFLLTPRALYVVDLAWTEPLLALTFSLVMFCACRCRRMLPYALGLFFATKQYTVLSLPALILLVEGEDWWKELWGILWRAGLVVAVITVPFFVWGPTDFLRAVAYWQLIQPFRADALSYLVWIYHHNGHVRPPIWTPFVAIVPAAALAVWRGARTPAGFAAAVTLINLAFFAFNKQAFCNYYYFVMATSCWAVAATQQGVKEPVPVAAPALG